MAKQQTRPNLMVTVSGGRSSALMAWHIQRNEKYKHCNKAFVFANTGMERPETIEFLKNIENKWEIPLIKIEGVYSDKIGVGVGYKAVGYKDLNMDALPFEQANMHINKGRYDGLPNSAAPYCSGMLKTAPSKKLCDDMFGTNNYVKAIGFRSEDMPRRISFAEIRWFREKKHWTEKGETIYPLIEDFETPVTQGYLNKFWEKQKFRLNLHGRLGNCELCWKKSDTDLIGAIRHGTRFVEWYRKEEKKYNNTSFRGMKSIDDLVRMAALPTTMQIEFDGRNDHNENNDPDDENTACMCSFN